MRARSRKGRDRFTPVCVVEARGVLKPLWRAQTRKLRALSLFVRAKTCRQSGNVTLPLKNQRPSQNGNTTNVFDGLTLLPFALERLLMLLFVLVYEKL